MATFGFIVRVSISKSVDAWGPEGAAGKPRYTWQNSDDSFAASLDEAKRAASKIVADWGLTFSEFNTVDGDPGRFEFCQEENDEGEAEENGRWLADYDVRVFVGARVDLGTDFHKAVR